MFESLYLVIISGHILRTGIPLTCARVFRAKTLPAHAVCIWNGIMGGLGPFLEFAARVSSSWDQARGVSQFAYRGLGTGELSQWAKVKDAKRNSFPPVGLTTSPHF